MAPKHPDPGDDPGSSRAAREQRRSTWKAFADVGSIGIEMGLAIGVGYWLGTWLDGQFGTKPVLMYVFLAAGIGAAFKGLLRTARKVMAAEADAEAAASAARRDDGSGDDRSRGKPG